MNHPRISDRIWLSDSLPTFYSNGSKKIDYTEGGLTLNAESGGGTPGRPPSVGGVGLVWSYAVFEVPEPVVEEVLSSSTRGLRRITRGRGLTPKPMSFSLV